MPVWHQKWSHCDNASTIKAALGPSVKKRGFSSWHLMALACACALKCSLYIAGRPEPRGISLFAAGIGDNDLHAHKQMGAFSTKAIADGACVSKSGTPR